MSDQKTTIKDFVLGLNLPQVIRYLYSGLLLLGLIQLTPAKKVVYEALTPLGDVLSILLLLFAGVVIWTFYHQFFGEFVLFRLVHLIHRVVSKNTSDMCLLAECGVAFGRRRIAYEMFRNLYLLDHVKQWVEMNHAHNQLLDITWIEILAVVLYCKLRYGVNVDGFLPLLILSICLFLASVMIDIRQHKIERLLMLRNGRAGLQEWLVKQSIVDQTPDRTV